MLTHWKEREHGYRVRRERIIAEVGHVPAYADGGDVDPTPRRVRQTGRLTAPQEETVSADEFEQMKRELGLEESEMPRRRPSRLTERTAHTVEEDEPAAATRPAASRPPAVAPPDATDQEPDATDQEPAAGDAEQPVAPAPDEAENDGVAPVQNGPGSPRPKPRPRNRRHGRRR